MPALYVSYDGLMEQLGQSQILPYLRHLAKGRAITLVTYEKSHDLDNTERRARFDGMARDAGIRWIALRYHKRPSALATAYDIAVGILICAVQCLRSRARIFHARGYVPSVIGLVLRRLLGVHFIFDMRGFWVDQRVEMGIWRAGSAMHRVARWLEARFLQNASVVFSLSNAAVTAMKTWPAVADRRIRFEVVTTCTDLERFTPVPGEACAGLSRNGGFTLGYVGNAGMGYLFDPVLETYKALRELRPDAKLKIVNRNDHAMIREGLARHGIDPADVDLAGCDYAEVPLRMREIDAGVFFVRPDPSRVSSVPTRMGEFLACGVPCIGNARVADVEEILGGEGVGVVLHDFSPHSIRRAAGAILELAARPEVRQRCVEVAKRYFSLEAGVATYERVYCELEGGAS